ncbi:MAG: RES family NAD+ phosphorylase [Candidatus Rokubacteria bacterium]|nr:RES family NAD+ phosphorylase [Candidatus Rokubacteria bacterium]
MLPAGELEAALATVEPVALAGPFFRTIAFKYLRAAGRVAPNILSGVPGRERGGRYNPSGGARTTYIAESAETALSEGLRPFLGSGVAPALTRPLVMLTVRGQLHRVLDLLDPQAQARVGTNAAELVAPYLLEALRGETPTQRLGRLTYLSGRFEAIRGPSAQRPTGHTIAVFSERVVVPSKLEVYDPDGILTEELPE